MPHTCFVILVFVAKISLQHAEASHSRKVTRLYLKSGDVASIRDSGNHHPCITDHFGLVAGDIT